MNSVLPAPMITESLPSMTTVADTATPNIAIGTLGIAVKLSLPATMITPSSTSSFSDTIYRPSLVQLSTIPGEIGIRPQADIPTELVTPRTVGVVIRPPIARGIICTSPPIAFP